MNQKSYRNQVRENTFLTSLSLDNAYEDNQQDNDSEFIESASLVSNHDEEEADDWCLPVPINEKNFKCFPTYVTKNMDICVQLPSQRGKWVCAINILNTSCQKL